ncbi:MAG: lysophospholipid acyltransferase family protein [Myxococcota bacterium]
MADYEIEDGKELKSTTSVLAGKALLKVMNFTFHGAPPDVDKFVIIAAPHTSNWDLPLMLACAYVSGLKISWLGKSTIFRGVGRPFFSWLGGVPVDRTASTGMVAQVAEIYKQRDKLAIAIPPEGTRARTDGWKTGFYYTALEAGIPIVMSYLDFSKREAGFGPAVMPSGDIEADFEIFREFYRDKRGRYPEWTSPVGVRKKRRYEKPKEKSSALSIVVDAYKSMAPTQRVEQNAEERDG